MARRIDRNKIPMIFRSTKFKSAVLIIVLGIVIISGVSVKLSGRAAAVGDLNGDGMVNVTDLSLFLSSWGKVGVSSDFNADGKVDVFDLSRLLANWGASIPLETRTLQLNDSNVGTGLNQFEFSGTWTVDAPLEAFSGDSHFSNTAGDFYSVRFDGTQVKVYAEKSPAQGIVAVSIDGGAETMADAYAATRAEQQLIYTSPVLPKAIHTINVRITGNKNSVSKGIYASADRLDVAGVTVTPTPVPTATPLPTPTPAPPVIPTVSGVLYYVSNSGSDANTGRSPSSAWKTVGKVNAQLGNGGIKYGDGVAFERGGEFFGHIRHAAAPLTGAPLTITAYGTGARPIISGYKVVSNQASWSNQGNNVWRVNIINGTSYSGMLPSDTANNNSDVGFIRVNGVIKGAKKWSQSSLGAQWDFYNDSSYLYVKSSSNPSALASDFRVATDGVIVRGFSHLHLKGVEIAGTGGHGFQQTSSNTRMEDCFVHEIGGSQLRDTTRYGNGIEIWLGSKNAIITGNQIADVYDTAVTIQGNDATSTGIHFTNNMIWNTTQVFEYWTMGSNTSQGIYDSSFTDNVAVNAGYSWSYDVRPDRNYGQGTFLMAYEQQLPVSINVARNIFFNPRDNFAYSSPLGGFYRKGYVSNHNLIALRSGQKIMAQMSYTFEQSAAYIAATGQDAQSTWTLVPSNATSPTDALNYVNSNMATLKRMIR